MCPGHLRGSQEILLRQGDSDESALTAFGEEQARRTAAALSRMQFDRCCHSRSRSCNVFLP